ncbi:MAG: hypothetical protein ABL886_02605, partial [Rhodoglobus sp.]
MKALSVAPALAFVGAAVLVAVGAAPAHAAGRNIDPGDSMYTINCDQIYNDWQLLSVAPPTAISTPIGDGDGTSEFGGCADQAAYDLTDGTSYYVQITFDGENVHWALAEINVATGVSTTIDEFWWENGEFPELVRVDAIAIGSDGAAYALGDGTLYSLDLASAIVDPIDFECVTAFAFASHPTTGDFYVVERGGEVWRFDDIGSGCELTSLGSLIHADLDLSDSEVTGVFALQIDGGGTFWIDVQTREGFTDLWSFTPSTLDAPVRSGVFTDDPFYTQTLLIIPGVVALASTGSTATVAPLLAAAALLL